MPPALRHAPDVSLFHAAAFISIAAFIFGCPRYATAAAFSLPAAFAAFFHADLPPHYRRFFIRHARVRATLRYAIDDAAADALSALMLPRVFCRRA